MSKSTSRAVLLRFDGVVHTSDLATQAFARHLAAVLPSVATPALIGGMRGFLEGKPDLIPGGIDLGAAEDGDEAVALLARAAGLSEPTITAARRASRADLAASAWAVDAADGLDALLGDLAGRARVLVWAAPADPAAGADPAAAAVLDSEGIHVDDVADAPLSPTLDRLIEMDGMHPRDVAVIGTRWTGELDVAAAAGAVTLLIDRHGRGRGTPTARRPTLPALLPDLHRWLADTASPDTAAPDTAAPDTAAPDTAAPDTAAPDTAVRTPS